MNPSADDTALWQRLREVYDATDPVPADVLDVAYGAYGFRRFDVALAALVADSSETLVTTRDDGPGRLVTFQAESVTIEVQISTTGETRRLVGQLVPPGPAGITVEWPTGQLGAEADELGRFSAAEVAPGPVRFACQRAGEQPTVTEWVVV